MKVVHQRNWGKPGRQIPSPPESCLSRARANVTPLESRQQAPPKDSWLLAFLPGCRPWRRFAPPPPPTSTQSDLAVTGAVSGHGMANDITRVGGLIGPRRDPRDRRWGARRGHADSSERDVNRGAASFMVESQSARQC